MATIKKIKRKRGTAYQIGFYRHGAREWVSLPRRYTLADAQELKRIIENILDAETIGRPIDARTALLIDTAPQDVKRRLERAELIEVPARFSILELLEEYLNNAAFKPSTIRAKKAAFNWLARVIPLDQPAANVTPLHAARLDALLTANVANTSRAGFMKDIKAVFNWAARAGLCVNTAFNGVSVGSFANKSREYYVTLELFNKLLETIEDEETRVLLTVYRFGGLRVKEAYLLQWRDVDFGGRALIVHSPKTERYAGRDARRVPLFPELCAALSNYKKTRKARADSYLFTKTIATVRNKTLQGLKRIDAEPWPRLFQNLRSSRAIEINNLFGTHAEAEWLGHAPNVASKHYIHATKLDFTTATKTTTK